MKIRKVYHDVTVSIRSLSSYTIVFKKMKKNVDSQLFNVR